MKRFIAIIFSVFIVFSTGINAYATGAEGVILGGGSELIGLSLTGPQTALVIAGLLGVAYTVDHGEEIYDGMCSAIDTAMDGVEDAAGKISSWWENACSGVIDTTSEVWSGICDWFGDTRKFNNTNTGVLNYVAGVRFPLLNGVGGPYEISMPKDGFCAEFYYYPSDNGFVYGGRYYFCNAFAEMQIYQNNVFKGYKSMSKDTTGMYSYLDVNGFGSVEMALSSLSNAIDVTSVYKDGGTEAIYEYLKLLTVSGSDVTSTITMPDVLFGGINGALENGELADVGDVVWPNNGTITLNPALETDVPLSDTMTGVIDGTIPWTDYWERVTTNPLPGVKDLDTKIVHELNNTGVSENEMEISAPLDTSVADNYRMDLTNIFPFCIPFDLYDFLNCLCAEPEAPNFKWNIPLSAVGLEDCTVEINLDKWDSVAQIFRDMELLAFCIGLAFVTRNLIRG